MISNVLHRMLMLIHNPEQHIDRKFDTLDGRLINAAKEAEELVRRKGQPRHER